MPRRATLNRSSVRGAPVVRCGPERTRSASPEDSCSLEKEGTSDIGGEESVLGLSMREEACKNLCSPCSDLLQRTGTEYGSVGVFSSTPPDAQTPALVGTPFKRFFTARYSRHGASSVPEGERLCCRRDSFDSILFFQASRTPGDPDAVETCLRSSEAIVPLTLCPIPSTPSAPTSLPLRT